MIAQLNGRGESQPASHGRAKGCLAPGDGSDLTATLIGLQSWALFSSEGVQANTELVKPYSSAFTWFETFIHSTCHWLLEWPHSDMDKIPVGH